MAKSTKPEVVSDKLAKKERSVADVVGKRVRALVESGELHLPKNYSADNAVKAAYLNIQQVEDKDGKAALSVCTQNSVIDALLTMVVLGLNAAKQQCYFVVFGKGLVCMRSRFGTEALTRRVAGDNTEINAQCVYKGDDFEYEIVNGRKSVTRHTQKLESIDNDNIVGAYCRVEPENGAGKDTVVMTIDQIRKSWQQGHAKGNSKAHKNFADEMCLKTVTNRACKRIINSSDDRYLVRVFKEQEVAIADLETEALAELEGNGPLLDFPETQVTDDHVMSEAQYNDMEKVMDGTPVEGGPYADDDTAPSEPEPTMTEEEPEDPPTATPTPPAQPGDYPEDEPELSPRSLFQSFVEEQEMDSTVARKVAADMVRLDDVRKLSNKDYEEVLDKLEAFVKLYKEASANAPQPSLTGTI